VLKLGADRRRRGERHEYLPEIFDSNGDLRWNWRNLRPQITAERNRLKQLRETTTEDFDSCPSTSNETMDHTDDDEEPTKPPTQRRNAVKKKTVNAKPHLGGKKSSATSCKNCRARRTVCIGGSEISPCTECRQRSSKCTFCIYGQTKAGLTNQSRKLTPRSSLLRQHRSPRIKKHTGKSGMDGLRTMHSADISSAPTFQRSDSASTTIEYPFGTTEAAMDERVTSVGAPPSFWERPGEVGVVEPVLSSFDVIECSGTLIGPSCNFKTFSGSYLETYCGIKLQEAKDFRQSSGYWLCPTCSYKDERISESQAQRAPAIDRIPSENGKLRFNDKQIEEPLARFHNLALHYILMVKQNPSGTTMKLPFLDLPFIRNEQEASHRKLSEILRNILDVPGGVPLGAQVLALGLQTVDPEHVLRGVVSKMFVEQVLRGDVLFDDVTAWQETLNSSESARARSRGGTNGTNFAILGFSPDITAMLIQDQRLRTLKSPSFKAKMNRECKRLREQLNADMYPFVGGSSKAQSLNAEMAEVAVSLHAVLNAYSGAFEIIWPRTGDEFNSELHTLDHVERHPLDTSRRSILWVTMGGIRYKGPGKDWRTCSPARVILADRPPNSLDSVRRTACYL
jgi:hypothetical protein